MASQIRPYIIVITNWFWWFFYAQIWRKKFGPIDGFSMRFNQFESGLLFGATFLERQPHLIRSIFRGPNNSLRRLYWLRLITVLFGWSAPHRAASRLNRMIKSQWTRKTGYIIHAPIYRHLCGARTIVANHAVRQRRDTGYEPKLDTVRDHPRSTCSVRSPE